MFFSLIPHWPTLPEKNISSIPKGSPHTVGNRVLWTGLYPQDSYAGALTANMMIFGGGAPIMRFVPCEEETQESLPFLSSGHTQRGRVNTREDAGRVQAKKMKFTQLAP